MMHGSANLHMAEAQLQWAVCMCGVCLYVNISVRELHSVCV